MNLDNRNALALRDGQARWEGMTPPSPEPDFLETRSGDAWLYDATVSMIHGNDLFLPSYPLYQLRAVRVEQSDFLNAVTDHLLKRLDNGEDEDNQLGQILVEIARRGPGDKLFSMLNLLMGVPDTEKPSGWTQLHEIADGLIRPHAEHAAVSHRMSLDDYDQ